MARERKKLSARKWADKSDSGFVQTVLKLNSDQMFNPKKAGTIRIEIVPYEVPENPKGGPNPNAESGELWYERTFFTHRGIGVDDNSYVCPLKTAGKPCPICEYRKELMRTKDGDEDMIKSLAPKQRQLWNVFDHGEPDAGGRVWEISYHLFGKRLKAEINDADEDEGLDYFADPDEGMTLRVGMKEKSGGGFTFSEAETVGFKPRRKPLSDEILAGARPLDDLLIILPYDKLKSIFLQEEGIEHPETEWSETDDDDDPAGQDYAAVQEAEHKDEPPPKKKLSKPKSESKSAPTAESLGIGKGDDVFYEGVTWTVVKVSPDGTKLNLVDDDGEIAAGVPVSNVAVGGGDSEPGEESPPEKPASRKNGSKPKPKPESPPADDGDWDADFDDEPAPAKKGSSKPKSEPEPEPAKEAAAGGDDDWDDDW